MKRFLMVAFVVLSAMSGFSGNCPVVDFGDDFCWYGNGIPSYRRGAPGWGVQRESLGGGDWRIGQPFSLEVPLSPASSEYNLRGNNSRFYGGMMTLAYNSLDPQHHWTEGGVNIDHDGFDDFNYMGFSLTSTNNFMRAFGVWLWNKEDFINGGDRWPVTFDENSRVAVFLSRTYSVTQFNDSYAWTRTNDIPRSLWRGWEDVHLIVQDGDQFYIAQTDFHPSTWTVYEVSPLNVKWAEYNPEGPWNFEWDKNAAEYKEHKFTDVRAAGWMIAKPTKEIATLWLKWYSFGMDAVVNRPSEASWNLPLVKADGDSGKDGLYIAKDPVTYLQWSRVFKWASRNQYCLHHGYDFNRDGNPGSVLFDNAAHSGSEPVTGITWQDAALWCNALSEYEGRTPCYYEDAAFTKVLRSVKTRTGTDSVGKLPSFYLRQDADGYRLPVASEMTAPTAVSNVWNFVWNVDGAQFNPAQTTFRTAVGGSGDPLQALLPAGEIPSRGHYAVSFRPVRREGAPAEVSFAGGPQKSGLSSLNGLPAWTFAEEEMLKPEVATETAALIPEVPMIDCGSFLGGQTEVTYAQWKQVFNWAEVNGYRFDWDGDVGSLKWDLEPMVHSQKEPVTSVSTLDAMVWCNALSEMNGMKPVYYADAAFTHPLRTVHPARALALAERMTVYKSNPVLAKIFPKLFFTNPDADGYRLPSNEEWTEMAGGSASTYPSGSRINLAEMWITDNSDQQTHPVGETGPTGKGFYDLAGNAFEWTIGTDRSKAAFQSARGGSFRSADEEGTPLRNQAVAANWSFGGSMNIGVANAETGFRVVRTKK